MGVRLQNQPQPFPAQSELNPHFRKRNRPKVLSLGIRRTSAHFLYAEAKQANGA